MSRPSIPMWFGKTRYFRVEIWREITIDPQFIVAAPGMVRRSRPGNPPPWLAVRAKVGPPQVNSTNVGAVVLATPVAETLPPMAPLSVKHSRNLPTPHVSPGAVQSAFVEQPR